MNELFTHLCLFAFVDEASQEVLPGSSHHRTRQSTSVIYQPNKPEGWFFERNNFYVVILLYQRVIPLWSPGAPIFSRSSSLFLHDVMKNSDKKLIELNSNLYCQNLETKNIMWTSLYIFCEYIVHRQCYIIWLMHLYHSLALITWQYGSVDMDSLTVTTALW